MVLERIVSYVLNADDEVDVSMLSFSCSSYLCVLVQFCNGRTDFAFECSVKAAHFKNFHGRHFFSALALAS